MKRWSIVLVPIIALGLLIGWRVAQKRADTEGQTQQRAARFAGPAIASTALARVRDIRKTFEATGSVEAPMNVKIAPKITGRIVFLAVEEGDRVRKGQTLVRIDDSQVEAEVRRQMAAVAEARYRLAQAQLNQNPTDVAITSQIRQQQAGLDSAEADLNQTLENSRADIASAEADLTDAQATIDEAGASVASAKANLDNARTRYDRTYSLFKQGFVSAQAVDDVRAALAVQESGLEAAKARLKSAGARKDAAEKRLSTVKAKGKADMEAARAKVTQARASLDSAQANTSQKSAYRQSIAALQAGVAAAQATLSSAQAQRRDTVLVSPLDGYVTGRYADLGAIASPTQPILSVQFMKAVWVAIAVPEEICSRLHVGQKGEVTFDALPRRVFSASVVQINPAADPESRQYTVRMVIDNRQDRLKPGMFARVRLQTELIPDVVAVPREAVQRSSDESFVVIVGPGGRARRTAVSTGVEDTDFISVTSGLRAGDRVVTMSSFPIRDGQIVVSGGRKGHGGRPDGARAR